MKGIFKALKALEALTPDEAQMALAIFKRGGGTGKRKRRGRKPGPKPGGRKRKAVEEPETFATATAPAAHKAKRTRPKKKAAVKRVPADSSESSAPTFP